MLILSRVCADFYDKRNTLLFRITQHDIGLFVDAPEAIREDPLFQMLVNDKSIKFPEDAKTNRALENDPSPRTRRPTVPSKTIPMPARPPKGEKSVPPVAAMMPISRSTETSELSGGQSRRLRLRNRRSVKPKRPK